MKRHLLDLGLALVTVALLLVLVEGAMRWADYDYRPLTIATRDDLRDTLAFREDHFEFDARLLWRPRRGYKIFNSQGFRGPVLTPEKAPGEVRLFTVGDSNTLGWKGEDGPNWPGDVGRLTPPWVRVVNAGVWGYSSFQGLRRLEEVLPLAPDIVTISFGSNDSHPVREADAKRAGAGSAAPWLKAALSRFRLGRVLVGSLDRIRTLISDSPVQHRVSLESYRENLGAMVAEVRDAGAVPVLMTRPYVGVPESENNWRVGGPDYNAATFDVARELDVRLIDLYSLFKHRDEFFIDDSHFTAEGNRAAARLVFDELAPLLESRR